MQQHGIPDPAGAQRHIGKNGTHRKGVEELSQVAVEQPEEKRRTEDGKALSPGGKPPQQDIAEHPFLQQGRQHDAEKEYQPGVAAGDHPRQKIPRLLSAQGADAAVDGKPQQVGQVDHGIADQRQRAELLCRYPLAAGRGLLGNAAEHQQQDRQAQPVVGQVGDDPLEPFALQKGDHPAAARHGQELAQQHQQQRAALRQRHHGKAGPADAGKLPPGPKAVIGVRFVPLRLARDIFGHGSSFPDRMDHIGKIIADYSPISAPLSNGFFPAHSVGRHLI